MSLDTLDDLLAGGGKTAKFETVGTTWSGVVTKAEPRQATNFDTGKPDFWDDGQPKMQAVVSIQTPERLDDTDDGVRAIYIKLWGDQKKAFRLASQAAGGAPKPGDTFTATYYADGEKPQRGFAPKLFRYEIKKANPLDAALAEGAPIQSAPVAQAAPVGLGAAAPVAAPAPAPAVATAPATLDAQTQAQIGMLLGQNLTAEQIAGVLNGVTVQQVEALRVQQAALAGAGF